MYKTEIDPETQKTNLWLQKGKGGRGINQEFEINTYAQLYTKQITNKDLLYSTGNYIQYLVITQNESEKEYIYIYTYIYITELLCCLPETNTTL